MKKFKRLAALLLTLALCLSLAACGGSPSGDADTSEDTESADASGEEPVNVVYWGTWGAEKQEYIQQVMDEFNASQSKYVMSYEYVGSTDDLLAKLQVTDQAEYPALINGTTEQTGTYFYSDYITPISEIADANDPSISMLYGNLVSTWGDAEGKMVGYPMGNSMAGIYFNMDMLDRIGVDPYTDITCLEDLAPVFAALVDGGVCEKAIGFDWHNIYLNYALSIEGVDCVDMNNGKDGVCTTALYDQPGTIEYVTRYFELWSNANQAGYLYNPGANWGNEVLPAFATGQIAIVTGTIGGYARLANAWNENHDTPCNIAFIPWQAVTAEGRSTGLPASGNGFYIANTTNDAAKEGAWEFIKFWSEGDRAATWCTITGYLPISDECYESQIYKDYIADATLDFQSLIDIQKASDIESYHPVTPVNTELQSAGIDALNKVIADPNYGIEKAIGEFAATVNDALEMWHLENG